VDAWSLAEPRVERQITPRFQSEPRPPRQPTWIMLGEFVVVRNRRFNFLLEGQIDQRKHDHRTDHHDRGGQQDKERGDGQVTKHFLYVNMPENIHWGRNGAPVPKSYLTVGRGFLIKA